MNVINTQYLAWLMRRFAKTAGLWGLLAIAVTLTIVISLGMEISKMQTQIGALEGQLASKKRLPSNVVVEEAIPQPSQHTSQTLSEFYQTFPTLLSIPDTLSTLNMLAAQQQLVLNSGDYKLNKIAAKKNVGANVLTQYEMVLPIEGSYSSVRALMASILTHMSSVAIADIQIERESTLSPIVDARLVLIFYVRGDQV